MLVVDHRMPGRTGLELIRDLAAAVPEAERPQVVMMTAHATVENAIEAMKLGAYDYLQKPFEVDELLVVVAPRARAAEPAPPAPLPARRARGGVRPLRHRRAAAARSRSVIRKLELVARVEEHRARSPGETGTGKELVARAIHARSAQRDRPLIKVNCAAIPEALLESELFGHVKGAFTGATANRRGRFALADGGTIFLDEIGTLGPARAGRSCCACCRSASSSRSAPSGRESVDVRVIAATNRDLRAMVAEGRFQEDLYYRLSVIPIELPPLRERREDVPLLVEHFVRKHAQRLGRRIDGVEPAALERLAAYHWPGNVRELENTIERAVVLATGTVIDAAALSIVEPPTAGRRRRPALGAPARQRRVGRAGVGAARPRQVERRQEGRGRESSASASARSATTCRSTRSTDRDTVDGFPRP